MTLFSLKSIFSIYFFETEVHAILSSGKIQVNLTAISFAKNNDITKSVTCTERNVNEGSNFDM